MSTVNTTNLAVPKAVPGSGEPANSLALVWAGFDTFDDAIGKSTGKISTTTVASNTAETVLFAHTIPAGSASPGSAYRTIAYGTASNLTTGTLTIRLRLGGVGGQLIASFVSTSTTWSAANWRLEGEAINVTSGASATWLGDLQIANKWGIAAPTSNDLAILTSVITKDSTVAQDLVLTAQFSANAANNTISVFAGFAAKVTSL